MYIFSALHMTCQRQTTTTESPMWPPPPLTIHVIRVLSKRGCEFLGENEIFSFFCASPNFVPRRKRLFITDWKRGVRRRFLPLTPLCPVLLPFLHYPLSKVYPLTWTEYPLGKEGRGRREGGVFCAELEAAWIPNCIMCGLKIPRIWSGSKAGRIRTPLWMPTAMVWWIGIFSVKAGKIAVSGKNAVSVEFLSFCRN